MDRELVAKAAITIQRFIRGFLVRRKYAKFGHAYNRLVREKEHFKNRSRGDNRDSQETIYSSHKKLEFRRVFSALKKTVNELAIEKHLRENKPNRDKIARDKADGSMPMDNRFTVQCKTVIAACRKNQTDKIWTFDFAVTQAHTKYHDEHDNSSLYYAAKNKNPRMCEYLLEKGADPNDVCSNGNTPYHIACQGNNLPVDILLLDHQNF